MLRKCSVIKSFKHKGLKRFFLDGERGKLPPAMIDRIEEILGLLDAAANLRDLDLPQLRLHPLTGDRKGQWAMTVRANWRIVFRFANGEPADVDLVDYH